MKKIEINYYYYKNKLIDIQILKNYLDPTFNYKID